MYGIYDLQKNEFRDEIYDSKENAVKEFRDYLSEIAFGDWLDNFDFNHYKLLHNLPENKEFTEKEKNEIVIDDLNEFSDKEFFDFFEFEVRELF